MIDLAAKEASRHNRRLRLQRSAKPVLRIPTTDNQDAVMGTLVGSPTTKTSQIRSVLTLRGVE